MGHWLWTVAGRVRPYIAFTYSRFGIPVKAAARDICPHCGACGKHATETRGSSLLETALWICFMVPGAMYSLWRMSGKRVVCPRCHQEGMVPTRSPIGTELVRRFFGSP